MTSQGGCEEAVKSNRLALRRRLAAPSQVRAKHVNYQATARPGQAVNDRSGF